MNDIQTTEYASPAVEMKSWIWEVRDIGNASREENRRNIEAKGRGNDSRSTRCKEIDVKKDKENHRRPITLCARLVSRVNRANKGTISYHLQGPYTSDPDLDWALNAFNVIKLDALPPAAAGRLAPEQKKLLGHSNGIVVGQVSSDIGAEFSQGKTANDCLVGLCGAVTPLIFAVKSTARRISRFTLGTPRLLTQRSTSQSDAVRLIQFPRSFSIQRRSRLVSKGTGQLPA